MHVQLLVDDLLVHSGTMPPVPSHARGILPTLRPPIDPHVISFGGQDFAGPGKLSSRCAKYLYSVISCSLHATLFLVVLLMYS